MKEHLWRITEPLSFGWSKEHVQLDLPEETARPESLAAVTDGGRIMPAQYDPARHALWACIDLAPLQELVLTTTASPPPDAGLRAEKRPGAYVLRNSQCAVFLADAVRIEDSGEGWLVTGPLSSLIGPDGVHRCASRLLVNKSRFFPHDRDSFNRLDPSRADAEQTSPSVRTAIEEAGSVFARYTYTLTMFDGRAYRFTATLFADQPILYVVEETDLGRDGDLEILISENFACDLYFFGGVGERAGESLVPLPPHEYRLGSLAPHHTNSQTAYPWLGFLQSDRPQGSFRGICDTALEPYGDVITFMTHRATQWLYPAEITFQFECREGRRVVARGPLRRGMREWCLFITDRSQAFKPHTFQCGSQSRDVSPFAVWHRKINDIPLDWIRRLDLHSGAHDARTFPQSVLTEEEFDAKRQGIFGELEPLLRDRIAADRPSCLYARWILNGDREAARKLADAVIAVTERKLAIFLNSGFLSDECSAVSLRCLGPNAVYYEACVVAGVLTAQETERLRTAMLLFAHATAEDALFPSHRNYLPPDHARSIRNWSTIEQYSDLFGTPNFQTDVYYNLALFGAVFPDHPRAMEWMQDAGRQLDEQLDFHFHPGGVYEESIGYFAHLFHNMLSLASVLKRHGVRDFFADERFQGAMATLVDYLGAPRRPTVERLVYPDRSPDATDPKMMRYWPAIGDTGHNCAEARPLPLLAHAAWEVREHNRELSDRLLAAWCQCGKPLWGSHPPMFEYLYVQELDPPCEPLTPKSRNFVNVGQMMRADVGRPSETSIFLRSGRATHHWGFDHGHFTLTTRGSLVIPDLGYHGSELPDGGDSVHGSATWVHNVVTFGPYWNGDTGMERRGSERIVRLADDFDYVVCDLAMNNVRKHNWRNIQPIVPIEYFRHFIFAHNRYVFVWDRIDHSVYPSQLRIHCLAESVSISGSHLHFKGLDDVDLIVNVIAPAAAEFHEGIVGPQRYVMCEQDCQKDYVWVCQPLGGGETEFEVTSSPNLVTIKGKDLHGVEFEDDIVYAKGDFGAEVQINGKTRKLHGRLALVRRDGKGEEVKLLDATSLQ